MVGYDYSKERIEAKIDDPDYKITDKEKEGMATVKEMLDMISNNTLPAGG